MAFSVEGSPDLIGGDVDEGYGKVADDGAGHRGIEFGRRNRRLG